MLTHTQPIAKQQTAAPSQLLAAGILGMIFCVVEYPFGHSQLSWLCSFLASCEPSCWQTWDIEKPLN